MGANKFNPSDPRDALAFARGVMAASSEEQARVERHQHHLAEAEEAKRMAGWLGVCALFLIISSFTADQWWTGVVALFLGVVAVGATTTKVKTWRKHRTAALAYETKH